jgi:acyl-CoA reductase-like NAD-dependent aldehyde dehydrogenase
VLIVDGDPDKIRPLADVLRREKLAVEVRGSPGLPKSLEDLQQFDLLMLSDVSALGLSREQMELYRRWVQDFGGGFVMIGGENSFGVGGYYRTPVEQMLPVLVSKSPMGAQVNNSMVYHQPVGVCGLIPTWNFPFFVTAQKIGPALATGCTMVIKPSPYAPLLDLLIAEVIETCDLPKGVFNVVTGESPELGAALVESPLVDKISYTGSVGTGKRILAAAAPTMKRVHLELGGKSAAILLDDADLDIWAPYTAGPSFFHAGQGCAMCTRVLVPQPKHDALLELLTKFVGAFVQVGDPADPSVMLGPVIREERRLKIEDRGF